MNKRPAKTKGELNGSRSRSRSTTNIAPKLQESLVSFVSIVYNKKTMMNHLVQSHSYLLLHVVCLQFNRKKEDKNPLEEKNLTVEPWKTLFFDKEIDFKTINCFSPIIC